MAARLRVTLKAAVTLDGRMATRTGDSRWITCEASRKEAHRLRAQHDVILVGIGTVLADDPSLTVRHVEGKDPLRVVLDSRLRTPTGAKLIATAPCPGTLVFCAEGQQGRGQALEEAGAEVLPAPSHGGLDLAFVLATLAARGVESVLVEGGAAVHGAFLDAGLADRAAVFVAPIVLGDRCAPSFAAGRGVDEMGAAFRLANVERRELGDDVLFEGELVRGKLDAG